MMMVQRWVVQQKEKWEWPDCMRRERRQRGKQEREIVGEFGDWVVIGTEASRQSRK